MRHLFVALLLGAALLACEGIDPRILDTANSQTQLGVRQVQTRVFDTSDKERTLRSVIATLQDLNFVIDKADLSLGTVSATKLDGYALRMTVSVRGRGERQMVVRANAQLNTAAITDPAPYQAFFMALERAVFLSAHNVD